MRLMKLLRASAEFSNFRFYRPITAHYSIKSGPSGDKPKSKSPITWKSVLGTAVVGGGLLAFMRYLKNEKEIAQLKERKRMLGKAAIGGKFQLTDTEGKVRSSDEFIGKWQLIYFGFTHCPDICPAELDKLTEIIKVLDETPKTPRIHPIFITVDPKRDTPKVMKEYLLEFSPRILGLTGTEEQIRDVCKAYRIYFSANPKDESKDYIVDHSIITYLMNPDGECCDFYGQNRSAEEIITSILVNISKFNKLAKKE